MDDTIGRRDFLTGVGTVAVATTSGVVLAEGQTTRPFAAANSVPRAADLVLRNGNKVLKNLSRFVEGAPNVKIYEVTNSTLHKIAATVAV